MKTKTLQQTIRFKASPREVYDMLMNSKQHRSPSGEPAKISPGIKLTTGLSKEVMPIGVGLGHSV
jgi:hypothetical protein